MISNDKQGLKTLLSYIPAFEGFEVEEVLILVGVKDMQSFSTGEVQNSPVILINHLDNDDDNAHVNQSRNVKHDYYCHY